MKNALITGASRGIGKAIAEKFESAGYHENITTLLMRDNMKIRIVNDITE